MDPIVEAIKIRRQELKEELKRLDRTLETYESERKVSTFALTDEHKERIEEWMARHDQVTGNRALDVAQGINLSQATQSILTFLRKSTRYTQVNEGKRNQRFRLSTLVKPEPEFSERAKRMYKHEIAEAKPESKPKKKRKHSGGVKKGYMSPKVKARYEEFKHWLETVPSVTTASTMRALEFSRAQSADLIKFAVKDNLLIFDKMVPPMNTDGSKAISGREAQQYTSVPYRTARETKISVEQGELTRGRLVHP